DPACGCGNFLVIAYRELRKLELEVLRELHRSGQQALDIATIIQVDVDQFHGIEIEEFPVQIAQVALWLTDHQMNALVSEEFGQYFIRLPLKKSAHIVHSNALRLDWNSVIAAEECDVVMGNPPFIGKKEQNLSQKSDTAAIFHDTKNAGLLDYVACWYRKATDFIAAHPAIRVAFVSTNSITQGEQVGVLWPDLLRRGVHIHFAHRTFQWSSEASGKAAVHCVIIGFGLQEAAQKTIFEYENIQGEPHAVSAKSINPYLVDATNILIEKRTKPISGAPEISKGSEATDFGHLILSKEEKDDLLCAEPSAKNWLRRIIGGEELINDVERWCLWLTNISPQELRQLPLIMLKVEQVRLARLDSHKTRTKEWAAYPTLFSEIRQPSVDYLGIPKVSSEKRIYLPISFISKDWIASGSILTIQAASLYHFGILSSLMHNAWMRAVCGRLESRYQYSASIVYNNFPWPEPTDTQRKTIETAAQAVLDARVQFPTSTLADLYDPLAMPPELVRAHQTLDRAVDAAYGKKSFASEAERVAFLFERYQAITSLLPAATARKPGKKTAKQPGHNPLP
ncbi:MAG: class I SAM-dependent DNA methyltransferase, partial [Nitrosomonas sp.]